MNSPVTADRTRGKRLRWLLVVLLLGVATPIAGVAYVVHWLSEASREMHRAAVVRGQQDLDCQLALLKSGKAKSVYLYDTEETDALLRRLEGMAEVEELVLELTDVTETGAASVATLPRLRRLVAYGKRGFTDRALARLTGVGSLEELELKNTRVTNDGLCLVRDFPHLRSLTIFCEPRLGVLNDEGLVHLTDLPKLESLALTGGWASPEGVAELRARLPHCKVVGEPASTNTPAGR